MSALSTARMAYGTMSQVPSRTARHDASGVAEAKTAKASTPFVDLDRQTWRDLRRTTPLTLTEDEVRRLGGIGEPIDLQEVEDVYLPLSRLIDLYVVASAGLHAASATFLGDAPQRTPFVIGIAGSVASGKSTTARILRELVNRWPSTPRVELVTTDGFLLPNAELERRNIMHRKGFPESYDQRALLRFVADVKSGVPQVHAPVYSHITYDILPDEVTTVSHPDVLIVEGLNVLQPARVRHDGKQGLAVSDFFDFSIYVHARSDDIRSWFINRFLQLQQSAFSRPDSYFHRYATLSDEVARATAAHVWHTINEPNLVNNILPTRARASLVLHKDADHTVSKIRLRRL